MIGVVGGSGTAFAAAIAGELAHGVDALGLCRLGGHAVDGRAGHRCPGIGARQWPLLHILRECHRVRDVHASQQHRAHARRKGEPRAPAMAVSVAGGIAPPPLLIAAWPTAKCIGRIAGAGAGSNTRGGLEGRAAAASARHRGRGAGAPRLPFERAAGTAARGADAAGIVGRLAPAPAQPRNLVRSGFDQHPLAGGAATAAGCCGRMHQRTAAWRPRPTGKALDCAVRVRLGDIRSLVLHNNVSELQVLLLQTKVCAAEIAHNVSARNRLKLVQRAKELGIKVLNPHARLIVAESN